MNGKPPTGQEREVCIQTIVERAVPPRQTLQSELKRLWSTVGIRYAFGGVGDAVLAALLVTMAAFGLVAWLVHDARFLSGSLIRLIPLVFFAPIFFFSLLAFSAWKERMCGTWQVLDTCCYDLRYITAFRVILVSLGALLTLPLPLLSLIGTTAFLRAILLALSALLLYGLLTLALLHSSQRLAVSALPAVWCLICSTLLLAFTPIGLERLFSAIPITVCAAAAGLLFVVYIAGLRTFILKSTRTVATIR